MNQIFRRKKNQEKNPKKIYKIKISYQKKMQITMKNTWLHGFGLCWIQKHLSKYLVKMDNAEREKEIKKWYCMNIVIVFIEYSFIPSTNKTQRAILNKSNKLNVKRSTFQKPLIGAGSPRNFLYFRYSYRFY